MVRYMAAKAVNEPEQIKAFDWSGYLFREDLSSDEEYGMRNVANQVLQLVDNYRSYSLLIDNESNGKGLGEKLYVALNRYRRSAAGHSIYQDPQPNEQSYPDIFF